MLTALIIWLLFDLVVYIYMWYDRKDHHFKEKFRDFKDSFEGED